jgi:hypothetical protein
MKNLKKLVFDVFREHFIECLSREIKFDQSVCSEKKWTDTGDLDTRRKVLEALNKELKKKYDMEFEINQRLLSVTGPVESAIIKAYHELSTINIMKRINAKIIARRSN